MVLIQHHVKYKEIHGDDRIVLMERSEHTKLHQKLRRENKCCVPVSELLKISNAARGRSPDRKRYESMRCKEPNRKKSFKNWQKNIQRIYFTELMCENIHLEEIIQYNHKTGDIYIWSGFVKEKR